VCTRQEVLEFFNRYSGQDVSKVGSMKFSLSDTAETYVNATAYPLFSGINSGLVSGNLVIFRDITEEQMARESRNEFIAQVGHELKTPMQIMGMYSEMLIDDSQASRELQLEVANVFNDQIDRINTLISNLLNVSKIEMGAISLDRQKVKLNDLLEDIYHYFEKSAAESDIEFAIECNIDLSPIYIDKELFRIAINNLVNNAIKYSDRGGHVTILVENSDEAITITVSDAGIGISPEDQPRIFDKFFRADNDGMDERPGHGLGLGLSKDIVEAHQGSVVVSSAPGQGAEFKIELQKTTMLLKEAA
jgi:two-component system sensor histidine kinase ResE